MTRCDKGRWPSGQIGVTAKTMETAVLGRFQVTGIPQGTAKLELEHFLRLFVFDNYHGSLSLCSKGRDIAEGVIENPAMLIKLLKYDGDRLTGPE